MREEEDGGEVGRGSGKGGARDEEEINTREEDRGGRG